ncbi:MAG TPA: phosphatidate cytidylyltransferase [Bacteroidales bacterium]|nr:phosphatidate cytidylyltransferase [Bacteroidales bacterium]HPT11421.1 phosphatidate cytidylyltransferase [Bacteroidales bacterium]
MNNLLRRTITGAFIVIFVLGGLWLHPVTFFLVGAVILAGTQKEYYTMVRSTGIKPQVITGIITGFLVYFISTLVAIRLIPRESYLVMIPIMSIIMVVEIYRKNEKPFDSLAHTFFSILYTAIPVSMFPYSAFGRTGLQPLFSVNNLEFSPGMLMGFFLLLWANDTGAYLVGSAFGKHRLMERISPKKSWEGFFGGLAVTLIVSRLLSNFLGVVDVKGWIYVALIVTIAGTFGDLIESMLKRSVGFKDSGTIMPGHGGFLDRFDSVVIAFPLVYLYIALFA